jgi:hypothetical protein
LIVPEVYSLETAGNSYNTINEKKFLLKLQLGHYSLPIIMKDPRVRAPESLDPDSPAPDEEHISSEIKELQSAFPAILALEKEKTRPHGEQVSDKQEYMYPTWNGFFALLSFPREIRDLTYFHYLYRPQGIIWHRRPNRGFVARNDWWHGYITVYRGDIAKDVLPLFLVSRQVYEEALYVFCSSNIILIQKRQRHGVLEGALRLFPAKAASILKKVEVPYNDYNTNPSCTWEKIVKDALVAKEHLPRLTEYTALWNCDWRRMYDEEGMASLQNESEDVKVEMWLGWLEKQSETRGVVPPRWLKVGFGPKRMAYHYWYSTTEHQEAYNRALVRFEEARAREERKSDELEESGKKWLEEEWGDGKRLRKKKHGR